MFFRISTGCLGESISGLCELRLQRMLLRHSIRPSPNREGHVRAPLCALRLRHRAARAGDTDTPDVLRRRRGEHQRTVTPETSPTSTDWQVETARVRCLLAKEGRYVNCRMIQGPWIVQDRVLKMLRKANPKPVQVQTSRWTPTSCSFFHSDLGSTDGWRRSMRRSPHQPRSELPTRLASIGVSTGRSRHCSRGEKGRAARDQVCARRGYGGAAQPRRHACGRVCSGSPIDRGSPRASGACARGPLRCSLTRRRRGRGRSPPTPAGEPVIACGHLWPAS